MNERISQANVYQTQPAIAKSLIELGQSAVASGLDAGLIYLVKLRVSQINACAFCLQMNFNAARDSGETQERLDVLSAWRELTIFNSRERAALAWAETLTRIADRGVTDDEFAKLSLEFSPQEIINLTTAIVAINGWNRIAVGFNFSPQAN